MASCCPAGLVGHRGRHTTVTCHTRRSTCLVLQPASRESAGPPGVISQRVGAVATQILDVLSIGGVEANTGSCICSANAQELFFLFFFFLLAIL